VSSEPIPLEVQLAPLDGLEKSTPISVVETRLGVVRDSLNGSSGLRREAVRAEAIARIKAAKIQGAAKMVNAALAEATARADSSRAGRPVVFDEVLPCSQPVDGAELLDDIANVYRRFVVLPVGGAEALALYALFTYCINAFDIAPTLGVTSPTMRCGKTTVLEITAALPSVPG